MKKFNSLLYLASMVVIAFVFNSSSCQKKDPSTEAPPPDSVCKAARWEGWVQDSMVYTDLVGNTRTMIFENSYTPDSICTNKYVSVYYSARRGTYSGPPNDTSMKVQGKAYWYFFYEQKVPMKPTPPDTAYYAGQSTNIGLAQAGAYTSIGLQVICAFNTRGSLQQDSAYVRDYFSGGMQIVFFYDGKKK